MWVLPWGADRKLMSRFTEVGDLRRPIRLFLWGLKFVNNLIEGRLDSNLNINLLSIV